MAPSKSGDPLGIYLHIPFCRHICSYCDFNTYSGQEQLIPDYVEALKCEIAVVGKACNHREAASVFIGGGTPSQLSGEQVAALIASVRNAFTLSDHAEITLEANPNDLSEKTCVAFHDAGINRLSIGVQTLHHRGLRVLSRQHEATDALSAYTAARQAGFGNISLDFIFGWPGQSLHSWRQDLEEVLGWPGEGPEHLSLYSLIVEPGTPMFDAVQRGILTPADDDTSADCYELAMATLRQHGWTHYEVANWSRNQNLVSRHNRLYWRNGEYVGIGAGAYGRIGNTRTMNHLSPRKYIDSIAAKQGATSNTEELTRAIQMSETMMLGLRLLREGVESGAFLARHDVSLEDTYGQQISTLIDQRLLEWHDTSLLLTPRGLMLANDVCARFL